MKGVEAAPVICCWFGRYQCTTVRRLCPAFFAKIVHRRRPPGASPGAPFAEIKLICIKLIPKTRGQPYYRNAFRVSARSSRPGGLFLLDGLVWAGRHWGPPSGPVRASAGAPASAPLAPSGPRRYAARSGRPAHPGGPSGPLCGPLRPLAGPPGSGGPSGPPPAVAPARRPPGRSVGPLRWSSGAGSAPPLRPRSSGSRFGLPGRRVPPPGGLARWLPWPGAAPCSPPGGGWGLSPRRRVVLHCRPLLLAPEDWERRRRTASRRSVSMSAMA